MTVKQIYQVINLANKQAFGENAIQVNDARDLVSLGDYVLSSQSNKDAWTNSMSDVIGKTIFVSSDVDDDDLGLSKDTYNFGAVLRKIRIKQEGVEENTEWNISDGDTDDPFKIHAPVVNEELFGNRGTYGHVVTVLDNQINSAFNNAEEMSGFYSLIFNQLDNTMKTAKKAYDRMALANFIGEKFNFEISQPTKMHTFNILKAYNTDMNKNLKFKDMFFDSDFLKYFASKMMEIKKWMGENTAIFNASDINTRSTAEYLNIYMLSALDSRLNAYLYSGTYHDEMVKINQYKPVTFWQGIKESGGRPFDAEATSSINLKLASDSTGNTVISQKGILCVMVHMDAVATTYEDEKTESIRIFTKGTNYWRGLNRQMINDMMENGIIIYAEDDADVVEDFTFTDAAGSFNKTFNPDTKEYTVTFANGTTATTLTAEVNPQCVLSVYLDETEVEAEDDGTYDLTISGGKVLTVEVRKGDYVLTYKFNLVVSES